MSEPIFTPNIQKGSFFRTGQQLGWSFINPMTAFSRNKPASVIR